MASETTEVSRTLASDAGERSDALYTVVCVMYSLSPPLTEMATLLSVLFRSPSSLYLRKQEELNETHL